MIQSCSHKSHLCPHCVFSNRPAPIPFHTVIFSHQKLRVYWAFPSREGSSSIWWRSISHFHRASSLSDSPSFPCFILHLISSPRSACGVWRRRGGSERKRTLEDCFCFVPLCRRGQEGRTHCWVFPFENYNYSSKIRSVDFSVLRLQRTKRKRNR